MRLGLLSDVHGNRVALEAVVEDGRRQGVDVWWALGDLVAIGPEPVETLALLRDLPGVRFVRGNTDRYVVTGDRPFPHDHDVERDPGLRDLQLVVDASFTWTGSQLSDHDRAWLAALPTEQRTTLADGTRLLGCHASPRSDDGHGITPDLPDPQLAALLGDAGADVVCGGHTHRPTDRRLGRTRIVNLGSVSNPITSDLGATYVIVDDRPDAHRLTHRRVPYDHEAVLAAIERCGHPDAPYLAAFQRGEQIHHPADPPGAPAFAC